MPLCIFLENGRLKTFNFLVKCYVLSGTPEAKLSRHLSIMEFDHGHIQHEALGRATNPGAAGLIS